MTREEAIQYWEQFDAEIDELAADNLHEEQMDALEKQREVVEFTISALRAQQTIHVTDLYDEDGGDVYRVRKASNDPLTMAELRKMDGEPVWVEFQDGSGGKWGIVHITMFNQIVFANGLHCTIGEPYYGKTWLAYRQKPEEGTK